MQQPSWNEGRLDDLNRKVDDGIGRLDKEHRDLRGEMRAGFDRMDARFDRMDAKFDAKFDRMDAKFDRLMWSLLGAALALVLAVIGAPHL